MFQPKQVIEGKIFIHQRRDELLHVASKRYLPGCYFECFIGAKNFTGHFVEVHCQPADEVRVIYMQKNSKNKIIALFNQTQQVIHLHPMNLIFSTWSLQHRLLPNILKLLSLLFILIFGLFALAAFSVDQFLLNKVISDTLIFTLIGFVLFTVGFVLPIGLPYMHIRLYRTLKLLKMLDLTMDQILRMEKMNPQNGIYHLLTQSE